MSPASSVTRSIELVIWQIAQDAGEHAAGAGDVPRRAGSRSLRRGDHEQTGIGSGGLYPVLARLETAGWLVMWATGAVIADGGAVQEALADNAR